MDSKQWDSLANQYHEEVISPFYGNVENPLFDELKKIKNKNKKKVAEFGCGLFYLGKELCSSFKKVHASDFSSEMVSLAKKRNKFDNLVVKKEDITKLKYKGEFDVIVTVNSMIMPSHKEINSAFSNLYCALKKDGDCFMVLPSMESVLYHGLLLLNDEIKNKEESVAKVAAKKKFENNKYDFFLGHYKDGKEKQKFYYKHEVEFLLKKAGFRNIVVKKVLYPWGSDISDYEDFPSEDRLWDWFVKAKK